MSSAETIITGFPQGFIDGPFDFFKNDLIQGCCAFSELLKMEKSPLNFSELLGKLCFLKNPPQISSDLLLLSQNNLLPVIWFCTFIGSFTCMYFSLGHTSQVL